MLLIAIGRCLRETDVSAPQQTEKKKNGLSCQVKSIWADFPQPQESGAAPVGRIIFETPFPRSSRLQQVGVRPCLPHRQATERRAGKGCRLWRPLTVLPGWVSLSEGARGSPMKETGEGALRESFLKAIFMAEPGAVDRVVLKECRA